MSKESYTEYLTEFISACKTVESNVIWGFWSNRYFEIEGEVKSRTRMMMQYISERKDFHGKKLQILEHFEKANGLELLDYLEELKKSGEITPEVADTIFAIRSFTYTRAIASLGESVSKVAMAVDISSPGSVFRDTELPALMNNPNIKSFILVELDGSSQELPKREAYHKLRDRWLDIAIERYNEDPESKFAKQALISEIAEAERCRSARYPFCSGLRMLKRKDTSYDEADIKREESRLEKVGGIRARDFDIDLAVLNKSLHNKLSARQQIIVDYWNVELRDANPSDPKPRTDQGLLINVVKELSNYLKHKFPFDKKMAKEAAKLIKSLRDTNGACAKTPTDRLRTPAVSKERGLW